MRSCLIIRSPRPKQQGRHHGECPGAPQVNAKRGRMELYGHRGIRLAQGRGAPAWQVLGTLVLIPNRIADRSLNAIETVAFDCNAVAPADNGRELFSIFVSLPESLHVE